MAAEEASAGGGTKEIVLSPKLDLKASEDLVKDLINLRGGDVVLDGSRVELFGAHSLQTLMIAARSWQQDGHRLIVTDLSEAAVDSLATLGVDQTIFEGERTDP